VADLRLEVTRAYWALLTARETVRVVRISLDRLGEQRDVARAQQSAGFVPPSDVLRVEAQRSRQRVLLIEAENAAAVVEADLRRLIGLETSIGIEIADRLDVLPQEVPEAEGLLVEAQDKRPERRAIEARIAGQGARASAADALRRPVLSIAGGYDVARPNPRVLPPRARTDDSWDVSVNASWLLWDGGRARAAQQEASASQRAARERLAEFDSILSLEVLQRRLDLSSALAAVAAAGDEVGSAAEARRVIDERYRAGVATSVELLNAQVALLEAELNRTRTLANVRLAQARLDRVVGR
jgi:OMF family outer membrane factor